MERIPDTHEIHGRVDIRHPIYDGVSKKRLLVSTNLYNLLRRLRDPAASTTLWIDALCINQDDFDERASQVLLMADIYRRARAVVLWLGEEDDETKTAFALADQLAHHPDCNPDGEFAPPVPMTALDLLDGSGLARLGLPPEDSPAWRALFNVFRRPVFQRVWIIQEMALARYPPMVLCGSHTILLPYLVGSMTFLSTRGWMDLMQTRLPQEDGDLFNVQSYADDIIKIRWAVRRRNQAPSIALVLRFKATDPRDKIYGMLGLMKVPEMPEASRALLQPDYRKAVEDVYRDATIAFILAENNLALLSFAGHRRDQDQESARLPSWVPDYAVRNGRTAALISAFYSPYQASGAVPPGSPVVPGQPRSIAVRAFRLDTIAAMARQDLDPLEPLHMVELIGMIRRLPSTYAPTGEEVEEALWKTLVGNCGMKLSERGFPEEQEVRESFKELMRFHLLKVYRPQEPVPRRIVKQDEKFLRLHMYHMAGRPFFVTRRGVLGMGGPEFHAGDAVYVVAGSPVPFVIRAENGRFRLVGDCYVHGIMDGEVLARAGFAWEQMILD